MIPLKCNVVFRSLDDYHQHLIYMDLKSKVQAQINLVMTRAGLISDQASNKRKSHMMERTSRIVTQYSHRQGAASILRTDVQFRLQNQVPTYGGGDAGSPVFTVDKNKRYYTEEAAISELLTLRQKLRCLVPGQFGTEPNLRKRRKSSWEAMSKKISGQEKIIEQKLLEIQNELMRIMHNDPNNELIGVLQKKYIIQRQNLCHIKGEPMNTAGEIIFELTSNIRRSSPL